MLYAHTNIKYKHCVAYMPNWKEKVIYFSHTSADNDEEIRTGVYTNIIHSEREYDQHRSGSCFSFLKRTSSIDL